MMSHPEKGAADLGREGGGFIQEHEVLSHLLSVLPSKAQRGLFSQDIIYTCIDASPEFIAVGTNASVVFLYDRLGLKLQRLHIPDLHPRTSEATLECVTKVKLAQSVDYVVAAGTTKGVVLIFQLPSYLPGRNKQLQMFQVAEVHTSRISCLCWSANTERLFCGDGEGNVTCTEIDYTKNISRSYLVSQEPHEVVQLDYAHRALLISTKFRTVIVFVDENFRKVRVGQKDRKIFGNFGACFVPGLCRAEDAEIYATRPGLRLWKASMEGVVSVTYMFKDLLNEKTPFIPLLPDTKSEGRPSRIEEKNFGLVHVFDEDKLVTWQDCTLFVLDPTEGTILGWHGNLGSVKDITVAKDEVFVLRCSPGSLIFRLALKRDVLNEVVPTNSEPAPLPAVPPSHPPEEHLTDVPSTSAAAAVSITILQQTASKMSQGLIGTLKEKISQVQEGQRPSGTPPPWGLVRGVVQQDSEESVESAREAKSNSSTSLDVISPMEPPKESPFPEETLKKEVKPESSFSSKVTVVSRTSENRSSDVQGVPGAHGTHRITAEPSVNEVVSVSGEREDSPVVKSTSKEKKKVYEDDIVFSRKPKKSRRKKKGYDGDSDSEELDPSFAVSEQTESLPSLSSNADDLSTNKRLKEPSTKEQSHTHKHTTHGVEDGEAYNKFIDSLLQGCERDSKGAHDKTESSAAGGTDGGQHHSSCPAGTDKHETASLDSLSLSTEAPEVPTGQGASQSSAVRPSQLGNLKPVSRNTKEKKAADDGNLWESPPREKGRLAGGIGYHTCLTESEKLKWKDTVTEEVKEEVQVTQEKTKTPSVQHFNMGHSVVIEEQDDKVVDLPEFPMSPNEGTDSSMEDFYSHYQSSFYSPDTPGSNVLSLEDALEAKGSSSQMNTGHAGQTSQAAEPEDLSEIYTDTWTEFPCPGSLRSLALSQRQVWAVDKNERLHYSGLQGPGLKWRKMEEPFHQVAVSPSGSIVWRLHRSLAYAATGISVRNPAGTKWNTSAKDVTYISVDENVAWYIKSSGNVYLQKSLSRERPTYQAQKVDCKQRLSQIACLARVVWALTENGKILVRTGICEGCEQGTDWVKLEGEIQNMTVAYLVLGNEGTAWILDDSDNIWFTTGVCQADPFGTKMWWQVAISDYFIQDSSRTNALKSLTNLPRMVTPADGPTGLLAVGSNGVWVCPGARNVLHICRGSLTGHRWEHGSPKGIAASAKWQNVSATAATKREGLIWVHQPNNAIFCFPPHSRKVMEIRLSGLKGLKSPTSQLPSFRGLCATREVVWLLLDGGEIFVRTGMGAHCPQGISWEPLDLTQIGGVKLISISCGAQNVWAVDSTGQVYLRIGLKPPSKNYLSPAWVPVDGSTQSDGAKFTKVVTGPNDWVVWALDNRRCVYVRGGITDALPIGTHWIYISGTRGDDLCISDSHVYTLNQAGEVFVRFGVRQANVGGDYWKKIPGRLQTISTTRDDELWAIHPDGQLLHRVTHFLERNNVLTGLQVNRCNSVSDDWEFI